MDGYLFTSVPMEIKCDQTFVEPIIFLIILGNNKHSIKDDDMKKMFGICRVLLNEQTISLIDKSFESSNHVALKEEAVSTIDNSSISE